MRSQTFRVLLLLTLVVVMTSVATDASAARRSALGGNQFINDADDMYAFPQLMMKYKDRVIFDLAPGDGDEGSGSVTFGDENVFQFNTGRSDFLNNTSFWAFGGFDRYGIGFDYDYDYDKASPASVEWWDVGYARMFGENPWGFNISWAKDADEFTPDGADPTEDSSTNLMSLQVGTTMSGVELAAEVGFGSYKDERTVLDPSDQNDLSFFNFALLGRGNVEAAGQNWRWIAAFGTSSLEPKMADAVKLSTTGFRGSFGPVWGTPGEWEVAAAVSLEYVSMEYEGSDIDLKNTEKYMGFPSYNMAMEYYINSWLVARAGVQSHNATDTTEWELVGGGIDENKERNYDFMWTAGIGLDKGNWGLDLALDEDDLHSGYLPLNGDVGSSPIAFMTAWLNW